MDKNTLSNYGWIVIAVLVLSVMIALATPFGKYIENGVRSTTAGLFDTSEKAMNVVGMSAGNGNFESDSGESPTTNLPAKGKTLEQYTWAEVQQIVQAGKASEYGFEVGQTKTLTISVRRWNSMGNLELIPTTKTATIIGLDHDGGNTATFMMLSYDGSGSGGAMNSDWTNAGGWEASEMRSWLNGEILNSMSNKDQIKTVTKMTNNTGYQGATATPTTDRIFLLSPIECGFSCLSSWYGSYSAAFNAEGSVYEWFNNNTIDGDFWLRSPNSKSDCSFFFYSYGDLIYYSAQESWAIYSAFVIG